MGNNLAGNIRSYRKNLGLTQEQLAERLGITLGTISKWERGSSEPDLSYIMDLAELFHVSVDALIGFSMRGRDADTEADRIEGLVNAKSIWEVAEEYERALKKFPNHFRIVCSAAFLYQQIGVVYKRDGELKKAVELFRHSIDLISQNRDHPEINEVCLRDEIAGCYSAMKKYTQAIEEYMACYEAVGRDTFYTVVTQAEVEAGYSQAIFDHMEQAKSVFKYEGMGAVMEAYGMPNLKQTLTGLGYGEDEVFYFGPSTAAIYGTWGGIQVDDGYRVLNNSNEAVAGLYAIGNAIGGAGNGAGMNAAYGVVNSIMTDGQN